MFKGTLTDLLEPLLFKENLFSYSHHFSRRYFSKETVVLRRWGELQDNLVSCTGPSIHFFTHPIYAFDFLLIQISPLQGNNDA